MFEFEIISVISKYNLGDTISLNIKTGRIEGQLIHYNDNFVKIQSEDNEEIITLCYSDIEDV